MIRKGIRVRINGDNTRLGVAMFFNLLIKREGDLFCVCSTSAIICALARVISPVKLGTCWGASSVGLSMLLDCVTFYKWTSASC